MSRNALISRLLRFTAALGAVTWVPLAAWAAEAPPSRVITPQSPKPDSARVFAVRDAFATDAFRPDPRRVRGLVLQGILGWTGKTNEAAAWLSLFSTNDMVGIKVFSSPGPNSGTRVAVAGAVAEGLLAAGIPPRNIVIWDKHTIDLRLAGFFALADTLGVRVESSAAAGYDSGVFYEHTILGSLVWGDLEFGQKKEGAGRRSYVSKLLTRQLTKNISIAPMLNHNEAGVSGHLYSMVFGSIDNSARFEGRGDRMSVALPELYNLPAIADKVALCITDGLICQYEGSERALLHYSAALNELRFSNDPVALDVLSIDQLARLRLENDGFSWRPPWQIYRNATLLELGTSDPSLIRMAAP